MGKISKNIVVSEIVRTFFKYFTTGVIEAQDDITNISSLEPSNMKRAMLEHYGDIADCFNREAFYAIMRLNFEESEVERELRGFVNDKTTYMELVRFACKGEKLYSVLVEEYKRNFEALLCGTIADRLDSEDAFSDHDGFGLADIDLAEDILQKLASNAYARGKQTKKG